MLTENYWKGILINSPVHFELGDINTLAEYLTEVSNGAKPNVSGSLPPSVEDITDAANSYLGPEPEITMDDVYSAGHFVAGATWAIEKMTGGNDR